jgi:hypothetical protein
MPEREVRPAREARRTPKQVWYRDLSSRLLDFWRVHGVDRTPRERQLYLFARSALGPRVNTYNVGLMLERLARAGVLVREPMMKRAVEYRLRRSYAFPMWPGYAREVEEILPDARLHMSHDGGYCVVGALRGSRERLRLVAANHFFAEYVAYRGFLHGCMRGLDARIGDHEALIDAAIREAPVLALRDIVEHASKHQDFPIALQIIRHSDYHHALADANLVVHRPKAVADLLGGPDLGRHAEAALDLLHAACGHEHLRKPPLVRRAVGEVPARVAFMALDAAVAAGIERRLLTFGREEREAIQKRAHIVCPTVHPGMILDEWILDARVPDSCLQAARSYPGSTAVCARRPMSRAELSTAAAPAFGALILEGARIAVAVLA